MPNIFYRKKANFLFFSRPGSFSLIFCSQITQRLCKIEDDGLNKNDAIDVQYGSQLVRPRRSVVSTTVTDCYKGFFASKKPPSGFRKDHTNIRYICQQVPGNTADYFYSTMFDVDYQSTLRTLYRKHKRASLGPHKESASTIGDRKMVNLFDLPKENVCPTKDPILKYHYMNVSR